MDRIHQKRLEKLITHLEKMPAEAFDMSGWIDGAAVFDIENYSNLYEVVDDDKVWKMARDEAVRVTGLQKKALDAPACGTVACIAGEASLLALAAGFRPKDSEEPLDDWGDYAATYLGLTLLQRSALFMPQPMSLWNTITKEQAIKVLTHFNDTGEVDWTVAGVPVYSKITADNQQVAA